MRVGVLGVGLLGTSVSSRLLDRGFEVIGYDIRPEQLQALRPRGHEAARSIADAAARADVVFTTLPSDESVALAIRGRAGLLETAPGTVAICQMSTISPTLARALGQAAAAAGTTFLDTPISGSSVLVARGEATIFVGGDPAHAAALQPVFDAIAPKTLYLGAVGTASLAKLAANLLSGVTAVALAEALVLGAKDGLDPATLLEALSHSSASSRVIRARGPLMVDHRFEPQSRLDLFLKDFGLILAEGQRLQVPLPLVSTVHQLCLATAAAGHGSDDLASVITTFERLAGMHAPAPPLTPP
jgi:3-hydroxyisobutyrate dehydrogenase-like beta-hydroxyacid dehydrogenase